MLEIFFNQKNEIPAYIYLWLNQYYGCFKEFGNDAAFYSKRHYDIYSKLQKEYIDRYRFCKQNDKDAKAYQKQERRKLCKLFRSGEYSKTFSLYGKSLSSIITQDELEKVGLIINNLFCRELNEMDEYEQLAAAYLLGRMQGRAEVKQSI